MKRVLSYVLMLVLLLCNLTFTDTAKVFAEVNTSKEQGFFEKCSSTFARDNLDATEQSVYANMFSILMAAYDGTVSYVDDENVDSSKGKCIGKVQFDSPVEPGNVINAFGAIINDNPLFFFLSSTITITGNTCYLYAGMKYDTAEKIVLDKNELEDFIKKAANEASNEASKENLKIKSDYDKEFYIAYGVNRYIVTHTDYKYDENDKPSSG